MSITQLIRERQRELMQRLDALERAAVQDNGGALPHTEVNSLSDEMKFLVTLTHERVRELEEAREPLLTRPPEPRGR